MAASPLTRSVALVGMPGAGKSAIGPILAARLGLPCVDTDELVAAQAGRTIAQLFRLEGEAGFRERERQAIAALLVQAPTVISTGGGAMGQAATRELLLAGTLTIWLQASPDTLSRRLASAPPRPLLGGADLGEKLRDMLADRRESYAEAELSLATDHLTPALAADALVEMLSRVPAG